MRYILAFLIVLLLAVASAQIPPQVLQWGMMQATKPAVSGGGGGSWTPWVNLTNVASWWQPINSITNALGSVTNVNATIGDLGTSYSLTNIDTSGAYYATISNNWLNGHPMIHFGGSQSGNESYLVSSGALSLSQPFEIYVTMKITGASFGSSRYIFDGIATRSLLVWLHDSMNISPDAGSGNFGGQIGVPVNNYAAIIFQFVGGTCFIISNNVSTTITGVGANGLSPLVFNQIKYLNNGGWWTNDVLDIGVCAGTNSPMNHSNYFAWATNYFTPAPFGR